MKKILLGFTLLVSIINLAIADDWKAPDINVPSIELNNLRFTNRARCALDSKKPTESVFLLIQNMEVAKGIYRMAKATGNDSTELTKMGIQVYRYAVINLIKNIHEKLMSGKLPLLSVDTTLENVPSGYAKISSSCKSDGYCKDLDIYLENLWNISRSSSESNLIKKNLQALDNFNLQNNFISEEISSQNFNLRCSYLKKFSPFQAQLYGSRPTAAVFEQLAKASIARGEYLGDCFDIDEQKDLKVASFQLELPNIKEKQWKNFGFDYWNSLKLYFSWAWRNAPEFESMASPFAEILRGVAIEESVMMVPNGCKSITPAKCDGEYVQLNAIRQFARESFKKQAIQTDVLSPIPDGPQDDMIGDEAREFPPVNRDILDMANFETAEAWMENFRDNLAKTRGIMKRKLLKSINFLNLATTNLSVEKIAQQVEKKFEKIGLKTTGELVIPADLSDPEKIDLKNDLYYLCSEFIQADHDDLSFIKGDLEILRKTTLIDKIAEQISLAKTEEFFTYYKTLATSILNKCNSLDQKQLWDDKFVLDKTGFSDWYIEKIYEGKVESKAQEKFSKYLTSNPPLLAFKTYEKNKDPTEVLCVDGPHCARNTLQAIVNLYAVAQYANTFWSMDQMIKTPALLNPYAERTACKVYDPWFKTKQMIFNLFVNMGQAAMSPFIPGAGIFASLDLQPGRVVSFNQLVEEGKITYDVKRDRASIFRGLVADFGPLIGVPCQIAITKDFNDFGNPYAFNSFAGITVGGCYNRDSGNLDVYSASDISDPTNNRIDACASCTINFGSVAHSMTAIGNFVPYVGAGLFLFDGMVRLYNSLKDPDNIPYKWESNPTYVLDTFRRFGSIPKKCVRELSRGQQCLDHWTEEKILTDLRKKLKVVNIKSIKRRTGSRHAEVMIHGCEEPIEVKIRPIRESEITIPSGCENLANFIPGNSDLENEMAMAMETERISILTQERERAETSRIENERAEATQIERERSEAARIERERAETARVENERAEATRVENERAEAARVENERVEVARIENERVEAARIENERREAARVERERAEAARIERDRAEAVRLERNRAEAARIERDRAEAGRIVRDRAEAERIKRDRAEAPRIGRGTPRPEMFISDIIIPNLKTSDCLVHKKENGINSILITRMKVTGILESSEKDANWFIKNPTGNDIPLYRLNKNQETLFVNNQNIKFNYPMPSEITVYSKQNNKELKVSIENCKGFKTLELIETGDRR